MKSSTKPETRRGKMQGITLGPFDDKGFKFDIGALGRHLEGLTDTRGAQYPIVHDLESYLRVSALTYLSGTSLQITFKISG